MYRYVNARENVFTAEGVKMLMRIRKNIEVMAKVSGVVTVERAISGCTGDNYLMLACIDLLKELGEVKEIKLEVPPPAQHRILKLA